MAIEELHLCPRLQASNSPSRTLSINTSIVGVFMNAFGCFALYPVMQHLFNWDSEGLEHLEIGSLLPVL